MTNKTINIALAGNPNCGKSTIFNKLVQGKAVTGNYSRVTVIAQQKSIDYQDTEFNVIDLPGVYSLSSQSLDELEARNHIMHQKPDVVVNVLDSGNLERNLFLSTQLIEMGINVVFVLNMIDEAERKGIEINTKELSAILKAPVVKFCGRKGEGVDELLTAIHQQSQKSDDQRNHIQIAYDEHVEEAIDEMAAKFYEIHEDRMSREDSRWMAIKMLEGDESVLKEEKEHIELLEEIRSRRETLAHQHDETTEVLISDGRFGFINGLVRETVTVREEFKRTDYTRFLDSIVLHRFLGIPLFFFIMWVMFEATFTIGAYPMDWIDAGVGALSDYLDGVLPESMTKDLIINGIIAGVGGTIIFVPNIAMLFLFIALLTETGYLARSAFLVDRVMHKFGLHGKAVIPMVMGFGCNVPAVMATRTIENEKDRLVAILVNPYMSCSARLPVFVLFTGAFFPENAGTAMFAVYTFSVVVTLLTAVFLSKSFVKGANKSPFIMELPPFRMPTIHSVIVHIWSKVMIFLKKITGIILVGSIIIWVLQTFPEEVELSKDYQTEIAQLQAQPETEQRDEQIKTLANAENMETLQNRYLGQVANIFTPVLEPLNFDLNTSIALITGIVAKEIVVATFGILYAEGEEEDEESVGLREKLRSSISVVTALAFMVFTLLYIPCMATIAVIYRETDSLGWTSFSVGFSLVLGWSLAYIVTLVGGVFV